ncbi:hypothetical protein [Streptomyces sp. AK02-01A]|uniref:hypothetical protein n=1 Tax=Streptomyces sp. AK02-01A TaxID=3028648 RepID=UPI0029B20156|nr:hypothetical protein [Streptomyces sp. AK02-01A]MDX3849229.1 hypothetical protein [Streptomyces sp. AK02-01A]
MSAGSGASGGTGRLLSHCLAVLIAAVALVLTGPGAPAAEAASVCSGRPRETLSFAAGELRIYKARHYVCALTVAKDPGARRAMSVRLQPRGGHPVGGGGSFAHRAGPVTVHALNRCVRATGAILGEQRSTGWILC